MEIPVTHMSCFNPCLLLQGGGDAGKCSAAGATARSGKPAAQRGPLRQWAWATAFGGSKPANQSKGTPDVAVRSGAGGERSAGAVGRVATCGCWMLQSCKGSLASSPCRSAARPPGLHPCLLALKK